MKKKIFIRSYIQTEKFLLENFAFCDCRLHLEVFKNKRME